MGHLVADIGCCRPGMVDTWAPLWGSCRSEGGEKRMGQMHSEGILTLWKVKWLEMIWLFSLRFSRLVSGGSSWLYLPWKGFSLIKKSCSHTQPFRRNIGGVWRKAYVFKFNRTFSWIPLYKWNVSLYQHHKEIMGILKGLQVTVIHTSEKPAISIHEQAGCQWKGKIFMKRPFSTTGSCILTHFIWKVSTFFIISILYTWQGHIIHKFYKSVHSWTKSISI